MPRPPISSIPTPSSIPTYHALIKTHHITSRKKVSTLKAAAETHGVSALLRSGGVPGIMYVEGGEREGVEAWVGVVHDLRYKDYQLLARPAQREEPIMAVKTSEETAGLEEVDSVKQFGAKMEEKGVLPWWRKAMGYTS